MLTDSQKDSNIKRRNTEEEKNWSVLQGQNYNAKILCAVIKNAILQFKKGAIEQDNLKIFKICTCICWIKKQLTLQEVQNAQKQQGSKLFLSLFGAYSDIYEFRHRLFLFYSFLHHNLLTVTAGFSSRVGNLALLSLWFLFWHFQNKSGLTAAPFLLYNCILALS